MTAAAHVVVVALAPTALVLTLLAVTKDGGVPVAAGATRIGGQVPITAVEDG
ncbi:hypothetical protein ACWPOB_09010 [Rhodococcus sp. 2H158]